MQNLEVAEVGGGPKEKPVDILIGLDFYYLFVTGKVICGGPNSPVAMESALGWIISGPVQRHVQESTTQVNQTHTILADCKHNNPVQVARSEEMKKLWGELKMDVEDDEGVYERFKKETRFTGKRYETTLPVKPFHRELPDNYRLSERRLLSLKQNTLDKDEKLKKNYSDVFVQYEKDGIIERVITPGSPGKTHYLPHHPVIKKDRETTKIRPVFDGSAKMRDKPSLNECLYSGPCLLNLIFLILLRFRMFQIGLISDIKQAFLNVGIAEEYRNYLRFL